VQYTIVINDKTTFVKLQLLFCEKTLTCAHLIFSFMKQKSVIM